MQNQSNRLAIAAFVISIIAVLGTWCGNITAILSLNSTLAAVEKREHQDERESWAQTIVFDIVDRESYRGNQLTDGLSFDQIREKYTAEAMAATDVKVDIKDLQPLELKKILYSLMQAGRLYNTIDGKFYTGRNILLGTTATTNSVAEGKLRYAILDALSREGGKLSVSEFYSALVKQISDLKPESYNLIINELISANAVSIDGNGKLWSAANPPKPQPITSGKKGK